MKILFQFAILFSSLILSINVFADVKIKIRQSMSGQIFENTTYIKGQRQRAEQNMGGMQTVNITQCDLKRSLQIMPVSQTFMINSWENAENTTPSTTTKTVTASQPTTKGGLVTTTVTIKDTGERKQMFGYTARHLIILMETQSSPEACQKSKSKMETDGWYIDATFALDCENERYAGSYSAHQKPSGCRDHYQTKQIGTGKRGYPVYEKMTMFDENGKESFSTVSEVLEFSKTALEDSLFDVPVGYREVKNSAELYQPAGFSSSSNNSKSSDNSSSYDVPANSAITRTGQNLAKGNSAPVTELGAKKVGIVRLGIANIKTGAVGEGLNALELAAAVQNTLGEYLKTTRVELVQLEAKLPSAMVEEANQKQCDYIVFANVSHKKGGGGFGGMFGKTLGKVVAQTGIGHTGSTIGNVAGQVATQAIVAATLSGNVKSKDEITLDIKLQSGNSVALTKQFKAKAKSDGEDIISPIIEQAAQAILDAVAK